MRGKESGLIGKAVGLRAVVPKSAVRAAEERDADDPSSVVLELLSPWSLLLQGLVIAQLCVMVCTRTLFPWWFVCCGVSFSTVVSKG